MTERVIERVEGMIELEDLFLELALGILIEQPQHAAPGQGQKRGARLLRVEGAHSREALCDLVRPRRVLLGGRPHGARPHGARRLLVGRDGQPVQRGEGVQLVVGIGGAGAHQVHAAHAAVVLEDEDAAARVDGGELAADVVPC